jgi:hypothetical protein
MKKYMVQEIKKVKIENGGRPFMPFENRKVMVYGYAPRKHHKLVQEKINELLKQYR